MFNFRKKNRNRQVYVSRHNPETRLGLSKSGPSAPAAAKRFGWLAGLDWSRLRICVVAAIFGLIWVGLWGRAWYLQMIEGARLADRARRQHMASELVSGRRGNIMDRNGFILARSVEAQSVYARPHEVTDSGAAARVIAPILGLDAKKLEDDLGNSKRRFVWLKRKVDDFTADQIRKTNMAGIGLSKEYDRVYPFKHLAGQLLGFVGLDDKGLEGLERSMEETLGAVPVRQVVQRDAMGRRFYLHDGGNSEPRGEDVRLTLDAQIQYIAEEAVARAAREFDASWSGALVIDVQSGDILAWAQYPFFNPNSYRQSPPSLYRNRLAADALEPGSTFKPLVMAVALQENRVSPDTLIDCEQGKWSGKKFVIRDTSVQGVLPANKVLRYSSNIGMAKIGLNLGPRTFHRYLQALGFGERTNIPVADSRGILRRPRDWNEIDVMTAAFGQSVSVTCLQMAQGYLTLLNNGIPRPLRLVLDDAANVDEKHPRVFSERTAREVIKMMRDVVEESDGTGKRARVAGISVGGKTGTAQKVDHRSGTYGSKRLASFVGFLPADKPRYLILVMVDEPMRNQYGGVVAAPVFSEIASRTLTYAGMLNESTVKMSHHNAQASRKRGLKLAGIDAPFVERREKQPGQQARMRLPGHLARAPKYVPDVMGKSVRNAVELFARAGIVPQLNGSGSRVIRQSPPAGSSWAGRENEKYILWLSER